MCEPFPIPEGVDEQRVQRARDNWRALAGGKGGNGRFWDLGLQLASSGLGEAEIIAVLKEEAAYRNPMKRLAQISSIIDSLKRDGKLP